MPFSQGDKSVLRACGWLPGLLDREGNVVSCPANFEFSLQKWLALFPFQSDNADGQRREKYLSSAPAERADGKGREAFLTTVSATE